MLGKDIIRDMNDRRQQILTLVSDGKKSVQELSQELDVSLVTIRNDLKNLEELNLLIRTHGGAELPPLDDISFRLGNNYPVKQRIALAGAELVNEGDTILLEAGSSIALLARELMKKRNITIITNNAFVARQFRGTRDLRIVLMGGEYQSESETMVGPMIREYLTYYNFNRIFIGMDGYTFEDGVTCKDIDRAEILKDFISTGKDLVVLSDSSKFGRCGIKTIASPKEISCFITDDGISPEFKNHIISSGSEVLIV